MSATEIKSASRQPKIVLVTGGLGYLGSQLIRDLADPEFFGDLTVRILDNLQGGHYQALMELPARGRYQFIEGDILDRSTVHLALQGVDAVIHLAAIVRTPMSFERPAWVDQVNHWGTTHLLEACLEMKVPRFIYASTSAVYGPGGSFREIDRCRPQGPYAQSKQQAEIAVLAADERGLQTTILRFGIMYGLAPVIRFDAMPNRFAYLAGTGRPLTIYGDGGQQRSLIHIRDASTAICFALGKPELTIKRTLNVIDQNISVLELADIIRQVRPNTPIHFTEQDIRTHLSFKADNLALLELGWQPQISVLEGLAELIEQFKGFETITVQALDIE